MRISARTAPAALTPLADHLAARRSRSEGRSTRSHLLTDRTGEVAEIAGALRPYGVRTHLSVTFAAPLVLGGLATADPLDEWIGPTFTPARTEAPERLVAGLRAVLYRSWSTYERCTAPLGVGFMVQPGHRYGPGVDGYEYSPWGTYHFADRDGVGVDRTRATGTGYGGQCELGDFAAASTVVEQTIRRLRRRGNADEGGREPARPGCRLLAEGTAPGVDQPPPRGAPAARTDPGRR